MHAQLAYDTYVGAWRGPVQFHTSFNGKRDEASHQIASGVIEIGADGQVRGMVNDTGCRMSGLAARSVTNASANLDVTLSQCADPRRNQRYSGSLLVNPHAKSSRLHLYHVGYNKPSTEIRAQSKR